MFSCAFDARACQHDSLFLTEYKRTNRTKGTKILRCFPHCCPEHVNRSYCGTALHVRVQSHAAKRPRTDLPYGHSGDRSHSGDDLAVPLERLYVFAHFEEVGARTFAIGDELPTHAVFQSLQTEQQPKGEWIQGHAHKALDATTHLFQINPGARWYYEWESAATKAQRFTKHVLKIYVFHHHHRAATDTLRVVAATASSEFMVVSYRRAPTDITGDRRILALLAENVVRQSGELGLEPDGLIASLGQKMLPFLAESHGQKEDKRGMASPTSSVGSHAHAHLTHRSRHAPPTRAQSLDDTRVWTASHHDVLAMSKRLAVLHIFLASVPAADFQDTLSGWSAMGKNPDSPTESSSTPPPMFCTGGVSWRFLSPLRGNSPDGPNALPSLRDAGLNLSAQNTNVDVLVHQCLQTLAWVVHDGANRRTLAQLHRESSRALLNGAALRELYLRVVTTLHSLVDHFLTSRFGTTFRDLHEEIVATLFRVDTFRAVRSTLLAQLSSTAMAGYEVFVSQARQGFVAQTTTFTMRKRRRDDDAPTSPPRWPGQGHGLRPSAIPSLSLSPFEATWCFESQQCVVVPLAHVAPPLRLSVGGALEWMREFASVSLALDATASTMALRSQWSLLATDPGMDLVLDGKKRVFNAFPSGVASTVPWNGLSWGDYRAQLVDPETLMLEFTAWPLASTSASTSTSSTTRATDGSPHQRSSTTTTALRVKLCARPSRLDIYSHASVLSIDGVVEYGRCPDVTEEFATLSINQRRAAVDLWTPLYQLKAVYMRA